MQEVTKVVNLQLTGIFKTEEYIGSKEEAVKKLAKGIEKLLNLDDVQVLNVKDFVRDID